MERERYDLVIGGETRAAASGERFATHDPATGEELASVALGGPDDIDDAVSSARSTFRQEWRDLEVFERARLLRHLSEALAERSEDLARLESLDSGKPLSQARTDVTVAAKYFEYYAGIADKIQGDTIPVSPEVFAYTTREPFGITGHIVPWNYPLQIAARTVAPSLAAGNCVVLKPAEETPMSAVVLGETALEAGLPPGVLNVVPGYGEEAGAALARHPDVDHIAFTGSPEVGREVMRSAADNITPVALELGGKSPHLVLADADIEGAVPVILKALIQNAGQTCSAGSRVVVDRSVRGELVDALRDAFEGVEMGHGVEDPDLGPLISEQQLERVLGYVEQGRSQGATLVAGGGRADGESLTGGFFVPPTMFVDVDSSDAIAQDEIFGPVLSVIDFDDLAQGLRTANDSRFGLVAAVWTRDIDRALWLARELEVGQVFINTYGAGGGVEMPFGGWKQSGFGREKGLEAVREYTQTKTVAARVQPG